MRSQTIINMEQKYPFGEYIGPDRERSEILVRKRVSTGDKELLQRAKGLKRLRVPYSIQIRSILQDGQSIQIYYEYVGVKYEIWMKSMSDILSHNLFKQLYIFTTFLADHYIQIRFCPNQLGLDKNYHIKYFLDPITTFYHFQSTPDQLKQIYYRQINLFVKSFHQQLPKNIPNPLFSSLNHFKAHPQHHMIYSIRSLPKSLDRNHSFASFSDTKKTTLNPTETTDSQVPENIQPSKKSATKKLLQIASINQKFKIIQEKLQNVKQNGPKVFFKSSDFHQRLSLNSISAKKAADLRKLVEQSKLIEKASMEKLALSQQREQSERRKSKKCSESVKDLFETPPLCFRPASKQNKSEKFKSQKNSQSPIEYLDLIKSTSEYVQDFLNVLEDSYESEELDQGQIESRQVYKSTDFQTSPKCLVKTQESQNEDQRQDKKWRIRFDTAIKKSKKLIERIKSPSKALDSLELRIK